MRYLLFILSVLLIACSSGNNTTQDDCIVRPDRRKVCGPSEVVLSTNADKGFLIEGTIEGNPAHLLIDTGSERTTFSSTLLNAKNQSGVLASFCVGEMCFRESVWAWDTTFSSPEPDGINGFVGMSTLNDLIVSIVPGNGNAPSIKLISKGVVCEGAKYNLGFTQYGTPLALTTIGGRTVKNVAVDSGGLFTTLGGSLSNALIAQLTNVTESTLCTVNGCDRVVTQALLSEYCVFGRCAHQVPVKYPIDNTIGVSFLSSFRIDFDFPNQTLVYCNL